MEERKCSDRRVRRVNSKQLCMYRRCDRERHTLAHRFAHAARCHRRSCSVVGRPGHSEQGSWVMGVRGHSSPNRLGREVVLRVVFFLSFFSLSLSLSSRNGYPRMHSSREEATLNLELGGPSGFYSRVMTDGDGLHLSSYILVPGHHHTHTHTHTRTSPVNVPQESGAYKIPSRFIQSAMPRAEHSGFSQHCVNSLGQPRPAVNGMRW